MSKIHELIAVEKDIKSTAEKIIKETQKTFTDKTSHFEGFERNYNPINEEDKDLLEGEIKEIVTTVPEKLDYFSKHMVKLFDLLYQKELSNISAKADLIVDGVEISKDIPVTLLVQLEKYLEGLRSQVYNSIPTLKPGVRWNKDNTKKNIYISPEQKKLRTKKTNKVLQLAPATKEHKEQVTVVTEDLPAGHWVTTEWSGMISSADKSDIMSRLDKLISGVKKARAKANNSEIIVEHIGKKIFDFINNDK